MRRSKIYLIFVLFSSSLGAVLYASAGQAQANFFQGKTIRVIRGGQAGDLYDLWTRHIATYLGKHIPGNPSINVQNMPGAGSVIAANYIYNVAKPDGLTLGSLNSAIYMDQVIGRKEVQFDWAKLNWFGTPEPTELLFIIRGTARTSRSTISAGAVSRPNAVRPALPRSPIMYRS